MNKFLGNDGFKKAIHFFVRTDGEKIQMTHYKYTMVQRMDAIFSIFLLKLISELIFRVTGKISLFNQVNSS